MFEIPGFVTDVIDYIYSLPAYVFVALAIASALMFVGGLLMIPVVVVRIPEDYFLKDHDVEVRRRHPVLHVLYVIGRNLLGLIVVAVGIVLALPGIPGQGILTIILGLMLMTIPGKKALIRRIVSYPKIFNGLNRLRAKYDHPPLILPSAGKTPAPQEREKHETGIKK